MFGRDISRESIVNVAIRIIVAVTSRARGWIYIRLGIVNGTSGCTLTIGSGSEIKNGKNIHINGKVKIGKNARLECHKLAENGNPGRIIFNDEVSLGNNVHIGSVSIVSLESGVLLGSNILIIDHNHGNPKGDLIQPSVKPKYRPLTSKGNICVEKNSWLCDGVVVLAGVRIGEGSIIGANAVVRNNVSAGSIVV